MKKLFLAMAICLCSFANAQIRIVDTFDAAGTLDWNEFAQKEQSALIKMGLFELENKTQGALVKSETELPVLPEYDFKVTSKLIVPKIEGDEIFGILFDMDEKFNRLAFIFKEDYFLACVYNRNGFNWTNAYDEVIKLPKAKNREIEVIIEQRAGKLIVSYENIEIFSQRRTLQSPNFGFVTTSKLKIDEVIVEQDYTGE